MLPRNQSGTVSEDKRRGDTCGIPGRHTARLFVLGHPHGGRAASILGRLAGLCWRRYIVRTDAGLYSGSRPQASAVLIGPLIDGGDDIKTSHISDVFRTQWAGRDVVVKRYNHVSFVHSLRHSIKGSRARRSWRNGRRLLELGIPTPRPLAYIDEHRGLLLWRSYLVTEYVDGRRLSELLEDRDVPHGAKRRIISQVLRIIHRLSVHGINHGDMKHTNILCLGGTVVLTDLDSVETHEWEWLHRQRQAVDMARFLRDVGGPHVQWNVSDTLPDPEADAGAVRRQTFVEKTVAGGRLYFDSALHDRELEESLTAGEEDIRRRYDSVVVESSQASRVLRFTVGSGQAARVIYFKEYLRRPLDRLKELFRPCRAMRAFHASGMLAEAGFLTPTIVAVGRLADSPSRVRSFLATEEVTGARPIYKYLVPGPRHEGTRSLQERRELLSAIGQTIGRMHRAGIVHGDLRPGNILARKTAGRWEFFFIDNERTRKRRILCRFSRLKNLVQINMLPTGLSRTDRMRFFHAYMLLNPPVCAMYKQWARSIMAWTHRRFRLKGWL
jgi:tRNA A-37 threonylcarbamoyl transferase component Bud32